MKSTLSRCPVAKSRKSTNGKQPFQSSKPKIPRGIREPRGYEPGNLPLNRFLASNEHIPGKPVSGESWEFFGNCNFYCDLIQMSVTCDHEEYAVHIGGLNARLVKEHLLKRKQISRLKSDIALELCHRILCAVQTEDGYFFRDLARICESAKRGKLSLRYWLLVMHDLLWRDVPKGKEPERFCTARELRNKAISRGVATSGISERYLRQICKELGVKILRHRD